MPNTRYIINRPVLLIHLDTAPGAGLTACTGDKFTPPSRDAFPNVPRVLCTGCLNVGNSVAFEARERIMEQILAKEPTT